MRNRPEIIEFIETPIEDPIVIEECLRYLTSPGSYIIFGAIFSITQHGDIYSLDVLFTSSDTPPMNNIVYTRTNNNLKILNSLQKQILEDLLELIGAAVLIRLPQNIPSPKIMVDLKNALYSTLFPIDIFLQKQRITISKIQHKLPEATPYFAKFINPYTPGTHAHTLTSQLLEQASKIETLGIEKCIQTMLETILFHYFPCSTEKEIDTKKTSRINSVIKTAKQREIDLTTIPNFYLEDFISHNEPYNERYLQRWLHIQEAILRQALEDYEAKQKSQQTQTLTATSAMATLALKSDTTHDSISPPQEARPAESDEETPTQVKLTLNTEGLDAEAIIDLIEKTREKLKLVITNAKKQEEILIANALLLSEVDSTFDLNKAGNDAKLALQATTNHVNALLAQLHELETQTIEAIVTKDPLPKSRAHQTPTNPVTNSIHNDTPINAQITKPETPFIFNDLTGGSVPIEMANQRIRNLINTIGFKSSRTGGGHLIYTITILNFKLTLSLSHAGEKFAALCENILTVPPIQNNPHPHERKIRAYVFCKLMKEIGNALTPKGQEIYDEVQKMIDEEASKTKTSAK